MVEAQRNRRLWLETAIIFAAWAVFGLLVANQSSMLSALGGRPMPWVIALRSALLEAALWAFTTLAIFWLARRFPLERGECSGGLRCTSLQRSSSRSRAAASWSCWAGT